MPRIASYRDLQIRRDFHLDVDWEKKCHFSLNGRQRGVERQQETDYEARKQGSPRRYFTSNGLPTYRALRGLADNMPQQATGWRLLSSPDVAGRDHNDWGCKMINVLDGRWMDRRDLLKSIAIGAFAGRPAFGAGTGLRGTAINHVSYESADYKKTRDFYVDLFGFQVSEEDDRQLYLWAGDSLISAKNTPRAIVPVIDHFGLTVEPWDLNSVEAALKERGLIARISRSDPHDTQQKSAFTRDPNGYQLQLGARDLETKPSAIASRAPLKAIAINHISYECADYKKTRDFYAELLGASVSNDDGKQAYVWFGDAFMVVRNSTNGSTKPAINYVAWTLADWDKDRVMAELQKHHLEGHADATGTSIMTKDLNGFPLQLCSRELGKIP
jgi:glyoxylase I family protein